MGTRTAAGLSVRSRLRRVLLLGLVLLLAVGAAGVSPAPAAAEQALELTLPPPTGHDRVGVVPLHLVDRSRPDPWVPSQPVRELMVSLWYPTPRAHGYPRQPWLPPGAWAQFEQVQGLPPGVLQAPLTHGRVGAPVERSFNDFLREQAGYPPSEWYG